MIRLLYVWCCVTSAICNQVNAQTWSSMPVAERTLRAQDEIWLVSSRGLGSTNCSSDSLDVHFRTNYQWQSSTASHLIAATDAQRHLPTVIFVHGNRWPLEEAIRRGLQTYEQTFLNWHDAPAVRFVIWTWPSDAIPGPIRDVRIKAERADEHSFHLARMLQRMPPASNVSLIGYSYGGRVTLGALHLLGGGAVEGKMLPRTVAASTPRVNLTLMVPAIRNDALNTTRSRAYSQLNHLYVLYNSRDTYLGLFKITRFSERSPALGYTGIAGLNCLPDHGVRVKQFNAAQIVGQDHDYVQYITDQRVEQGIRQHLFLGFDP